MTFLIFEGSWHVAKHFTWSSIMSQLICWIDNKLNSLIYLIIFF